jgi:hypothetical protein
MGSIALVGEEDERIKAGESLPNNNREEDCVGNWREHPQIENGKRRFHLVPGINERIIAKALREQP